MAVEVTTDLIKDFFTSIAEELVDLNGYNLQELGPSVPQEQALHIIDKAGIQEGDVILDAGSGTGYIDTLITQQFARTEITALDISPVFNNWAEKIIVKTGADRARFKPMEGDFTRLSSMFEPNTFDKILFLESILYSPGLLNTLIEAKKVLKPTGQIFIKDTFCLAPENNKEAFEEFYTRYRQLTLKNIVSLSQIVKLFESLGFVLRSSEYVSATNPIKLPNGLSNNGDEAFKKIIPKMLNLYIDQDTTDLLVLHPMCLRLSNTFEDKVISSWSLEETVFTQ